MKQEFVKCPCCDKMVPADTMELSYRLPDAIACMDKQDIEDQCKYTDDYLVCNDEFFYIRCTIPLPVHDSDNDYSIGAWAQVSRSGFQRVWELWSDVDQENEPPFRGLLSNIIHLNTHTEDIEIEVKLTGPKSRPTILIKDTESSLYSDQKNGITIHRASEYSDLCR